MCSVGTSLVQRGAGGHAARQALHARPLEVGDAGDVGRDDGHRVRGVDEEAVLTKHHVAVLGRGWDHTMFGVGLSEHGDVLFLTLFISLYI